MKGDKMNTLRELLKPPFMPEGTTVKNSEGKCIFVLGSPIFAGISQWEQWNLAVTVWINDAMNDRAAREWGERKRWVKSVLHPKEFACPVCRNGGVIFCTNYCPSCGERLDPPEDSDAEK